MPFPAFWPPHGKYPEGARGAEIDFSCAFGHDSFMMKLFNALLLGCAVCWGSAAAGVRMVDVVQNEAAAELIRNPERGITDAASCRKAADRLNREAERHEALWAEAFMSGYPTPQEWSRMAEVEARAFREALEGCKKAEKDRVLSIMELEEKGVISHEDAELVFAALRRLMWVSKTAVDSLDDFIAGARLPLPSSPDGDSHEKLLAWELDPGNSLSSRMGRDPVLNGSMKEALERCWNGAVMEFMESLTGVEAWMRRERIAGLIRRHADDKVALETRRAKLPPLTPEQWCWYQKQAHGQEVLERSVTDLMIIFLQAYGAQYEPEGMNPVMDEALRYWAAAPERIARVWKERAGQEEGR